MTRRNITKQCPACGGGFQPFVLDAVTCSDACRKAYFTEERSPAFKGGRYLDAEGFWVVRLGPHKYRREHRVNAEKALGRSLLRNELVLFLNGDTSDPRAENLYVSSVAEHRQLMTRGLFPTASNLVPLTYQQPCERGSSVAFQEGFRPQKSDRPPSGPWHRGRRQWAVDGKTRGAPHVDEVAK